MRFEVRVGDRHASPPLSYTGELGPAAVQIFAANDRMNQVLIEHLDPRAWRAKPPGKTRPIAAIFTHMHNVRTKWVRLTAPHLKVPAQLNRAHCTPGQARSGLAESAERCAEMLAEALGDRDSRIEAFHRDGWAPSWPVGPEMLCYMLAHEAHHRGQVCMLAHQLGFPLPNVAANGIWNWEKLWKDSGWSTLSYRGDEKTNLNPSGSSRRKARAPITSAGSAKRVPPRT
jgi:uncharacterized damage-inducible protein DinB